jgi:ParB family chromosome partitioning protein
MFVGLDTCRQAGGHIITDLFQSNDEGYLTEPALLARLCAATLEREAEAIGAEGWQWAHIIPDTSFSTRPDPTMFATHAPTSPLSSPACI